MGLRASGVGVLFMCREQGHLIAIEGPRHGSRETPGR